ncbi:MAG: CHAT domain-containing protein [Bacteroidia bacterium]
MINLLASALTFGQSEAHRVYADSVARVHYKKGSYDSAAMYFHYGVNTGIKLYGDYDKNVEVGYYNAGYAYKKAGKYEEALPFLQNSVTIYKYLYGIDSGKYVTRLADLAECSYTIKKNKKCKSYYMDLAYLTSNKEQKAEYLNKVTMVDAFIGDYDTAADYAIQAYNLIKGISNPTISYPSLYAQNAGFCFFQNNQIDSAKKYYQIALEDKIKEQGRESDDYYKLEKSYAKKLNEKRMYTEALPYNLSQLPYADTADVYDMESKQNLLSNIALGYYNKANSSYNIKDYAKAADSYKSSLTFLNKQDSPNWLDQSSVCHSIAMSFFEIKAYDSATNYIFKQTKLYEQNNYSDSLTYGLAVKFLALNQLYGKNYTDAINNYKIALNVLSNYHTERYTNYLYSLSELRHCYRKTGELALAIIYGEKAIEQSYKSEEVPYNLQLDYLDELIEDYASYGLCDQALKSYKKVFIILKDEGLESSKVYADKSQSYGNQLCDCNEYNKALDQFKTALSIYKSVLPNGQHISDAYYNLGSSYFLLEKYSIALQNFIKAKDHLLTIDDYSTGALQAFEEMLGATYENLDNHSLAVVHYQSALGIVRKAGRYSKEKEIDLIRKLIAPTKKIGEKRKSLNLALQNQSMVEEVYGKTNFEYFNSFRPIVSAYISLKLYDSAHYFLEKGYEVNVLNKLEDSSNYKINKLKYDIALIQLASLKSLLSIVSDDEEVDSELVASLIAKGKGNKALQVLANNAWVNEDGTDQKRLAELMKLINSASFNQTNGSLIDAATDYQKTLIETKEHFSENTLVQGLIHKELGSIYTELREYNQAGTHLKQCISLLGQQLTDTSKIYVEAEIDFVELNIAMGKYDKAITDIATLTQKTQDLFGVSSSQNLRTWLYWGMLSQAINDYDNARYAYSYVHSNSKDNDSLKWIQAKASYQLAVLANEMGKTGPAFVGSLEDQNYNIKQQKVNRNAISYIEKSENIYEELEGKKSPKLALAACHKAYLMGLNGDIDGANELYDFYLPLLKKRYGAEHPAYGDQIQKIGDLNHLVGDPKLAAQNYKIANAITMQEIQRVFSISTEAHRKAFYKSLEYNFDKLQQFNNEIDFADPEISAICLNNHLTLKSLLLHNQKAVLANLKSLKDKEINQTIASYSYLKNKVAHELNLPKKLRGKNIQNLINERDSLEGLLIKHHNSSFPDHKISISNWLDIRDGLQSDEVAIEFSQFHFADEHKFPDSIVYVAYVIKKDYIAPKVIPLFNEHTLTNSLTSSQINNLYSSRGAIVQGDAMEIDENVYNLIWGPLEEETASKNTVYISVSGTLNRVPLAALADNEGIALCQKHNIVQYSTMPTFSSKKISNKSATLIGGINYSYETPTSDTTMVNQAWKYLKGTKDEVDYIANTLEAKKYSVKLVSDMEASEEYFKKLNGSSPAILHLATHGFYKADTTTGEQIDKIYVNYASDPMMRSGLILAGGNYAWQKHRNPFSEQDGILTATEIANLDLHKTGLVVLSACETGLGDIDGNEGVYGLQRGFRMAGVDNLILSLWSVPDQETAEFMKLFYTKLVESEDVRNAFNATQREMQKKYSSQPYLWAGFILVE